MSEQIAVGVDGSAAAENALIWAAETASRRGAHLVIAYGDTAVHRDEDPATSLDYDHQLLREAVATAIEVSGTRDISTVLRSDPPTNCCSSSARRSTCSSSVRAERERWPPHCSDPSPLGWPRTPGPRSSSFPGTGRALVARASNFSTRGRRYRGYRGARSWPKGGSHVL